MSNGPKYKSQLDGLLSQAANDLVTKATEEATATKYGMLEGLAKAYLASTGHKPEDVTLVEQFKDGKILYYFAKKSDLGV